MELASDVLARIQPLAGTAGFEEAWRFLKSPGVRYYVGGGSNRVLVSAVLHAWGTRLSLARSKGRKSTIGCEHLVATLADLPTATPLEYKIFELGSDIACFWFIEASGDPVGFVVGQATSEDEALP